MQSISSFTASALILSVSMSLFAQSESQVVTYSEGNTTHSMNVQSAQFTPTHPEVCLEKKLVSPAVTPMISNTSATKSVAKDADKDGVIDAVDKCPNTPHGYKVDPTGCPVSVTLHLHFAFDSSVIPASDYPEVAKLARIMKENPSAKAIIVGHTDHTGTDEYNQKLSEKRSGALKAKLIENGIKADLINASGRGEKEPIATNTTREGRALNRRIEVELQ